VDHSVREQGAYLVDPVRVQDAEVAGGASSTLLSDRAQAAGELELGDSLLRGLTVDDALRHWPLAATTANAHTVDDKALLGLVAQTASLVGTRGARGAVDRRQLAVLPASHAKQEAEHVALLLLPEFLQVLVRACAKEEKEKEVSRGVVVEGESE